MSKSLAMILLTIAYFFFFQEQVRNKEPKNIFEKDKPFEIISSQRGITTESSANDTAMCEGWIILRSDLTKMIKNCQPIDGHQWHDLFDVLPCVVIGQLRQNGETYKFEINAGAWMYVYCQDTVLLLGSFKKENEKYFLSKAWSEIVIDTLKINGQPLIQTSIDDKFRCLTTLSGDTIVNLEDGLFKIEFVDIDEDGFKDIRVFAYSNTPNQCENYLFDKQEKIYRHIDNAYLDFSPVRGTKYFYSYNRAGCGDMNWQSHLIKIVNWKAVVIGFVDTKGCGDSDDGIYIYKAKGEDKTFLKKLPIVIFDNNGKNNKWDFIKDFWAKNYKDFVY